MANLYNQVYVNGGSTFPMYSVTLNDGGSDGGSNSVFNVGVESPGSITSSNLEEAVQNFASGLASLSGFTVTSVKKITVSETTL